MVLHAADARREVGLGEASRLRETERSELTPLSCNRVQEAERVEDRPVTRVGDRIERVLAELVV
eukprot:7379142-Prymnesium_polylepis.2